MIFLGERSVQYYKRIGAGPSYHSPIDLEISKKYVVKCREHGQNVGVFVQLAEILAMLIQCPGFVPSSSDTWIILPIVEQLEVLVIGVVESNHSKMLLKMGYPSAVDDGPWLRLWFPDRMHSVSW